MKPQEFTATYAKTVHIDTTTQETYIRIPITDYIELSFMQQSLLENLHLLSQLESEPDKNLKNCVFWLAKILLASYPDEELEGVSKLIKVASKML